MAQNKTWKEYFVYEVSGLLTGGSGSAFSLFPIRMDSDGDFEFVKTTFIADNDRIKLRFRDDNKGIYLMSGNIDVKAIFGRNILPIGLSSSFLPFYWPYPHTLAGGASFTVEAADYSGVNNNFRLAFHGYKIRTGTAPWEGSQIKRSMVYGLTGGAMSVAANATVVQTIVMDQDSDFLLQGITGIRTGSALINISEDARGRSWFNQSCGFDNIVGNGNFANKLPAPRWLRYGGAVVISIQDTSGNTNVIDVNLIGAKYARQQQS